MKKRLLEIFLLISMLLSAASNAVGSGETGFAGLDEEYCARLFSMGGAGLSSINDINACLVDPSQLTRLKGLELSVSGNQSMMGSRAGSFSIAYPMPFGTFGFTITKFIYGDAEFGDGETTTAQSTFTPADSIYAVSFGNNFLKMINIGLNVKYVSETLTLQDTREGFAVDVSTHFDDLLINRLNVALAVRNLGASGTGGIALPFSYLVGLSRLFEFDLPFLGISDIRPTLNLQWMSGGKLHASGALEMMWYHVPDQLDIIGRVGYVWPSETGFLGGARAGVGLHVKNFDLDYGFGWLGDLGWVQKMTVSFKLEAPESSRTIRKISRKKIEKTLEEIDRKFDQGNKK